MFHSNHSDLYFLRPHHSNEIEENIPSKFLNVFIQKLFNGVCLHSLGPDGSSDTNSEIIYE